MGITGCMLVKNEEKILYNSLESLSKFVDEIIVVDNGSEDDTVKIAKEFGCRVISSADSQLDEGRNLYLEEAKEDWIFVLDADEYVDVVSGQKIRTAIAKIPDWIWYIYLPRFEYLGNGKWTAIRAPRLFRNKNCIRYNNFKVHASVTPSIVVAGGKCCNLYAPIHHYDILLDNRAKEKRLPYIKRIQDEIIYNSDNKFIWTQYGHLGTEYTAIGNYEEAEKLFLYARSLSEFAFGYTTLYLAILYQLMGDYDKATYEAVKLVESHSSFMERALILLAQISILKGDKEAAVSYCSEAYELDYESPHLCINLASLLEEAEPRKAIELLDRAVELNPFLKDPFIYGNGSIPNMFSHQTSFLSSVENIFIHYQRCCLNLDRREEYRNYKAEEYRIIKRYNR